MQIARTVFDMFLDFCLSYNLSKKHNFIGMISTFWAFLEGLLVWLWLQIKLERQKDLNVPIGVRLANDSFWRKWANYRCNWVFKYYYWWHHFIQLSYRFSLDGVVDQISQGNVVTPAPLAILFLLSICSFFLKFALVS